MAMPAEGLPSSLKVWLYCWAPSSTRATSFSRVMRPPLSVLTMMFSNSETSSSLPCTLTEYWKACPWGTGGSPTCPALVERLCRLTASMTSLGTSPRTCSFCGSSQMRIAYCPAPNTDTLPTPSMRDISSTRLIVA